ALAPGGSRIVEKGKARRALDLERAVAGEKHRGRMGVDALDRRAAMGRRVGEQREDRLLALAVIHPLVAPLRQQCSCTASSGVNVGEAGTVRGAMLLAMAPAPDRGAPS